MHSRLASGCQWRMVYPVGMDRRSARHLAIVSSVADDTVWCEPVVRLRPVAEEPSDITEAIAWALGLEASDLPGWGTSLGPDDLPFIVAG